MPAPDIVEVWHIRPDLTPASVAALARVLSEEETRRWRGFVDPRQRRVFLAAHGAARMILGGYLAAPPAELRLHTGRWGKPELDGHPVRFSLSHAGGAILLAVSAARAVGVDIEYARPQGANTDLAARFFPAEESALVAAADSVQRPAVYLRLWTRKEACVKAAGARLVEGLGLRVADSSMPGGVARSDPLLVVDGSGRLPGPWLVRDLPAPVGYAAALALCGSEPYRVRTRRWRPA